MSTPQTVYLIDALNVRYLGILSSSPIHGEGKIALYNARSLGTEEREPAETHVPPKNDIYEFILFNMTEVRDITPLETGMGYNPYGYPLGYQNFNMPGVNPLGAMGSMGFNPNTMGSIQDNVGVTGSGGAGSMNHMEMGNMGPMGMTHQSFYPYPYPWYFINQWGNMNMSNQMQNQYPFPQRRPPMPSHMSHEDYLSSEPVNNATKKEPFLVHRKKVPMNILIHLIYL